MNAFHLLINLQRLFVFKCLQHRARVRARFISSADFIVYFSLPKKFLHCPIKGKRKKKKLLYCYEIYSWNNHTKRIHSLTYRTHTHPKNSIPFNNKKTWNLNNIWYLKFRNIIIHPTSSLKLEAKKKILFFFLISF